EVQVLDLAADLVAAVLRIGALERDRREAGQRGREVGIASDALVIHTSRDTGDLLAAEVLAIEYIAGIRIEEIVLEERGEPRIVLARAARHGGRRCRRWVGIERGVGQPD